MSGPKRSRFSISNSIRQTIAAERRRDYERRRNEYLERCAKREAIAREKAEQRVKKEEDLRKEIKECRSRLKILAKEHGAEVVNSGRVEGWIASAEKKVKGDLRDAWRELNGARSFLVRKEGELKGGTVQRQHQHQETQTELSEAELLLIEVEEVISENPAISSPGIAQRLELYRGSLKINRENSNILDQLKSFLAKVNDLAEENAILKKEREFAIRAFAEAIGAEPPGPEAGQAAMQVGKREGAGSEDVKGSAEGGFTPTSFSGSIAGMPITVVFEDENNLLLNTPEHGDCKTPLKALRDKLAEKGVELGSVRIVKTGENWNPVSTNNVQNRVRA